MTSLCTPEEALRLTRTHLPTLPLQAAAAEPLLKGGSDRSYFRITAPNVRMILCVYGTARTENALYADLAIFLSNCGIRVPKVIAHQPENRLLWLEDLGALDLWHYRNARPDVRQSLYQETLAAIAKLHVGATKAFHALPEHLRPPLQAPFDATLYLWEQDYFRTHCLKRHLGWSERQINTLFPLELGSTLANQLECIPRHLVHRDFQSQNVLIENGGPAFIDFQGMRMGLPQYDVASLLLDPYVELPESEIEAGIQSYKYSTLACGGSVPEDFDEVFTLAAMQRLMQALGAYGFLGYERERADFLAHFPAAIPRLVQVLNRLPLLRPLAGALAQTSAPLAS
jgi:N-acetylmuramate 1-kinase